MVKADIRVDKIIHLQGLSSLTDEINLELALQNFGKIKFL